ncbi:XdhC family protein [Lentzea sp. BCCO 10_0061]|uniref:XdhC family protein n=1 Tax=Lentzea sokolovensis TaxID=3095429 RepID=A0ABU4V8E6_9PSEU|nr:XdhC family protein [Lentzea sp. BCCO 10_0061]MDX8147484.1 XdhC family protein [Lentzea sp. BCCO 10_0061]
MLREVWPFVVEKRDSPMVLARLVDRDGPGARPLGATMAIAADGTWRGSVSGGCVEGMVLDAARAVLDGEAPGVAVVAPGAHLMPWEETPACAGELRVLLTHVPDDPVRSAITSAITNDRPLSVRIDLTPPYAWSVGTAPVDGPAFVEELPGRNTLVLVGATDLAASVAALAESLHRRVVILDPRPGHVASGAFPVSCEVIRAWPDEWITSLGPGDAVVALTHDPRIDDLAIRAALGSGAGHVAALGSRATHAQRLRRLEGVPGLERVCGPAGLDLGGASLAETALSILAEVVAVGNARSGRRLRDGRDSIRTTLPAW